MSIIVRIEDDNISRKTIGSSEPYLGPFREYEFDSREDIESFLTEQLRTRPVRPYIHFTVSDQNDTRVFLYYPDLYGKSPMSYGYEFNPKLLDPTMVPICISLKNKGFRTYFSCSGLPGEHRPGRLSRGYLLIGVEGLPLNAIRSLHQVGEKAGLTVAYSTCHVGITPVIEYRIPHGLFGREESVRNIWTNLLSLINSGELHGL